MKAKAYRNVSIAKELLAGKNQRQIAEEHDISQAQVSRILSKDEQKTLIDNAVQHNIKELETALLRHDSLIASKDEGIALKGVDLRYKVVGIATPHPSVFIQNVHQDNRVINYEPHIQRIIDNQVQDAIDGEIIEVKE